MIRRFVGIATYNRAENLEQIISSVIETVPEDTMVAVADDGSTDNTLQVVNKIKFPIQYLRGPNSGVAVNKNRLLFLGQQAHYLCLLEDDLYPTEKGWFEDYEKFCAITDAHHICRVQDKEVPDPCPTFTETLKAQGFTPVLANSPRGDLTFITSRTVRLVGAFNPKFRGAGYAHGEWSERAARAGLVVHPLKWMDIKEARDKFEQIGDTEGGRWEEDKAKVQTQIRRNKVVLEQLKKLDYIYHPLTIE